MLLEGLQHTAWISVPQTTARQQGLSELLPVQFTISASAAHFKYFMLTRTRAQVYHGSVPESGTYCGENAFLGCLFLPDCSSSRNIQALEDNFRAKVQGESVAHVASHFNTSLQCVLLYFIFFVSVQCMLSSSPISIRKCSTVYYVCKLFNLSS